MATTKEYKLGRQRGEATGREEPTDRDIVWVEQRLGRTVQDLNEVARGMRDGAAA